MEVDNPFAGYVAPPLDGIWATAPFLHNASVPTLELVLNSLERPTYWRRENLESTNFDEEAGGWRYIALPYGQRDASSDENVVMIYDTTFFSQDNGGHNYGDHYTDAERRAVIEYLKTL